MKLNKSFLTNIGLCLLIACLFFLFSHKRFLEHWELDGLDFSFILRGRIPTHQEVIIVEITDADIAKVGRWPWPRSWQAAMARALGQLGAKCVFFDILFAEPGNEQDDALFEEALKAKDIVYLPFAFQSAEADIKNAVLPIERFSRYAKGTGSINIAADPDGNFRKVPLIFPAQDKTYPHIALALAMGYTGMELRETNPRYLLLSGAGGEIKIPLIQKNTMLVNWSGPWQYTFKHYDFLDVLSVYKDLLEHKVPATAAILEDFKDSICVVAVTAMGLYDIKAVPVQAEYPGIGITATALSNILDRNFLNTFPRWVDLAILYLFILLPAFFIRGEKPLKESGLIIAIGILFFLASVALFRAKIYLGFTMPLAGLFTSYITVEMYNFVRVAMEKRKFFKMAVTDGLTGLFNIRYFKMILEAEVTLAKHDPQKQFCVVMSDVDHFKHFNDTYGHQVGDIVLKEVANALKSAVRASDLVSRYGGEEMIVLLRGVDINAAMPLAEKLRKAIEERLVKDGDKTYKVTASLGVSFYRSGDDVDGLIKRADDGLYKSKEGGRNRVSSVEEGAPEVSPPPTPPAA